MLCLHVSFLVSKLNVFRPTATQNRWPWLLSQFLRTKNTQQAKKKHASDSKMYCTIPGSHWAFSFSPKLAPHLRPKPRAQHRWNSQHRRQKGDVTVENQGTERFQLARIRWPSRPPWRPSALLERRELWEPTQYPMYSLCIWGFQWGFSKSFISAKIQ